MRSTAYRGSRLTVCDGGERVARKTVAASLRRQGSAGIGPCRFTPVTTIADPDEHRPGGKIRQPAGPGRGGRRPETTRLARLRSPWGQEWRTPDELSGTTVVPKW